MTSQTNTNQLIRNLPKCDCCNSSNIIETTEGFVCRTCGVVQDIQKLEHTPSFNKSQCHHAVFKTSSNTLMGLKSERMRMQHSPRFFRLQKMNNTRNRETLAFKEAEGEVSRLLDVLGFPHFNKKQEIINTVNTIWKKLPKGTKFRNVKKLVPVVLFASFKSYCISVPQKDIIQNSLITKKEFVACLWEMYQLHEEYSNRNEMDKIKYISQMLMAITERFSLGMDFYHRAYQLMKALYPIMDSTKEEVAAGLACSLIALLPEYKESITVQDICSELGIRSSTIQDNVKKNLIRKFHIQGFTTLVASAPLMQKIVNKVMTIHSRKAARQVSSHPLKKKFLRRMRKILQIRPQVKMIIPENEEDYIIVQKNSRKIGFKIFHNNRKVIKIECNLTEFTTAITNEKYSFSIGKNGCIYMTKVHGGKGPPEFLI